MRKYIVVLMVLSGVAAAQRLRVPLLHRDPVEAQRTALHEKMTRLAETRASLGMPETQPASELDALTASATMKRPTQAKAASVARPHAPAATASAWPPPPQAFTRGEQQPSLGEVARKERARKRQVHSSSEQ